MTLLIYMWGSNIGLRVFLALVSYFSFVYLDLVNFCFYVSGVTGHVGKLRRRVQACSPSGLLFFVCMWVILFTIFLFLVTAVQDVFACCE